MASGTGSRPSQGAVFLQGNLLRHIAVMALTSSLGLMAVFAVDLVDMIFISMLGKAELAAAVGYAGAILFFTTSFGIGMAIAAGAVVARTIGEGYQELARQRSGSALFLSAGLSAIFAFLVWISLDPLVGFLGATGETKQLAIRYLQILVPSIPVLICGIVGGAILRAHGDARRSMMSTLIGAVVNAVLDPIFIFGLGMELQGAAIASVISRFAIAYFAIRPIIRHHGGFESPTRKGFIADTSQIGAIAVPAILTQFATPVGQVIVTRAMAPYGEEAVAGMAIVGRLAPVAFATIFALSGAVGPIIGQNYGAGKRDRVKAALTNAAYFTGAVILLSSVILFLLRPLLTTVFDLHGVSRQLVYLFAGPLSLLFFFNGIIFVANAAFNNLGRPYYSTWINWGRNTLGTLPFVWIGSVWYGAPGVLAGMYAGGLIFAVIAWIMANRVINDGQAPPDKRTRVEREARTFRLLNQRR